MSIETILVTVPVDPRPFERRRLSPLAVLKGRLRESTRRHDSHAHHSGEEAVATHPPGGCHSGKPFFGHKKWARAPDYRGGVRFVADRARLTLYGGEGA